jgi:competence/damage-inducible protein CinA-like protein
MRSLTTAEILSIGSELTVGETRDTNAGDLARALTERGVEVVRMTALPDDLAAVRDAFLGALEVADLVIATGGLGPTPDDLTREALSAAVDETPTVDADVSAWLEALFARRRLAFPEANRKQAWRIPSATIVPNEHGTAPGWWVDRPDGRVVVVLPGPPREMRPMWERWVVPRLSKRDLGRSTTAITLRTTGLGESVIADRLGSLLDRDANPTVATYARADGVDIRISAVADGERTPTELVEDTEARVLELIGEAVWARGSATWPAAILEELERQTRRLAIVEIGLRGALVGLLAEGLGERLSFAEALQTRPAPHDGHAAELEHLAGRVRELGGCEVGLAVEVAPHRGDLAATIAISTPEGDHREHRLVFLDGPLGRSRAAIAAASALLARLRARSAG